MSKKNQGDIVGSSLLSLQGHSVFPPHKKIQISSNKLQLFLIPHRKLLEVADVPEYDGKHQEIEINGNQPEFTKRGS